MDVVCFAVNKVFYQSHTNCLPAIVLLLVFFTLFFFWMPELNFRRTITKYEKYENSVWGLKEESTLGRKKWTGNIQYYPLLTNKKPVDKK